MQRLLAIIARGCVECSLWSLSAWSQFRRNFNGENRQWALECILNKLRRIYKRQHWLFSHALLYPSETTKALKGSRGTYRLSEPRFPRNCCWDLKAVGTGSEPRGESRGNEVVAWTEGCVTGERFRLSEPSNLETTDAATAVAAVPGGLSVCHEGADKLELRPVLFLSSSSSSSSWSPNVVMYSTRERLVRRREESRPVRKV